MNVPGDLLDALRAAKRVLIATHSPMDGDGLGCGLALQRALRATDRDAVFVTEAPVPRAYKFLPAAAEIVRLRAGDPLPEGDLVLGLDAGEPDRLGRPYAERTAGVKAVNIDHHVSNARYGDIAWVDPAAASTGELVYGLLRALDWPIDATTAQYLLISLVTDTGRFCYSSTTSRTFEIAAELVRAGAEPDGIQRNLYGAQPRAVLQLRGRAVPEIEFHADGAVAMLTVPAGYAADLGVDAEDVKDLVDVVISVKGVVVGALVRGLDGGGTKVSLRSKDDRADVAALAGKHGGGGHVRAAGFSSADDPETTARALLPELHEAAVAASG